MENGTRVAIYGVTGFIGKGLPTLLNSKGIEVTGISRSGAGNVSGVSRWLSHDAADLENHQAVINLSGERIDRRWTRAAKREFHTSRVGTTEKLIAAIARLQPQNRPRVLINASAVGIYGDRGDEILTESAEPGNGYLAELCVAWETAAHAAEALGVRVICLRTGVVLGRDGGAYQRLAGVFKLALGGRLGSGEQWVPWIHLTDLRRLVVHCLDAENLSGPVNGSAPNPVKNRELTAQLAASLRRPAVFPVPAFALKTMLGEFSSALLGSQRAIPVISQAEGFRFNFLTLDTALADLAN